MDPMQQMLTYALGSAEALAAHIDRCADAYIRRMSGHWGQPPALPSGALSAMAHADERVVRQWISTAMYRRLGLSCAEPRRSERRRVLLDYARRGIVTMAAVDAADADASAPATTATAPAAKPRTLNDIAAEFREAREEATRLSVAAAQAEKRMGELRAELTRAVEDV